MSPSHRLARPTTIYRPTAAGLVESVRAIAASGLPRTEQLARLKDALDHFVAGSPMPQPETWRNTTGRYTRVLLNDPADDFQIIAVFWPPGARSSIHDHDQTVGAVMPLFGALRETKYGVREHSDGTVGLSASRFDTLEARAFSPITEEDGEQLHDVVNATCEWAATLHVYLRRIDRFHVYVHDGVQRYRRAERQLWVDYTRGAGLWDDANPSTPGTAEPELCSIGGCLCGSVRFHFTKPPAAQLVCHCTDCQRATGSAMAPLAFFPAASLVQVSGETRRYGHRNDSGHVVGKEFCAACGTTLFHTSSGSPHLTAVPVGVLDDASGFTPTTDIYVGSSPHWARVLARPWDPAPRPLTPFPARRSGGASRGASAPSARPGSLELPRRRRSTPPAGPRAMPGRRRRTG